MTDLYLVDTPDEYDITLTGRDLRLTTEDEDIRQRLVIHLQFLYAEWFLDTTRGVPYTQTIFEASQADIEVITAIFRRQINRVEGVNEINTLEITFEDEASTVRVTLVVNKTVSTEIIV